MSIEDSEIFTENKPLVDFVITEGQNLHLDYVEARYIHLTSEGYTFRNGALLGGGVTRTDGIGLRVLHNGNLVFLTTAKLNRDSLSELVRRAKSMVLAAKRKKPIQFSQEPVVEDEWKTPYQIAFAEVPVEEKQQYFATMDQTLHQEFGKSLPNRTIMVSLANELKYIATNEGSKIFSEKMQPVLHTFNTAVGDSGSEQRFFGIGGTGGWEWFKNQNILQQVRDDTLGLVKTAKHAQSMKLGKIDVIISSEVAGIMAHENVGHPSEADRILGREGAQAGESFYVDLLKDGELGSIQLGNPEVTIIEDPTLPGSSGFYLYDDECVKARPRALIKDGMLNELLLNREFAHRFGVSSNGAARAETYDREPIVRMANTYFKPGSYTLEELAEDINHGMYMKSFSEWNIDDRRYQSKYVGLECYLIEKGEITEKMIRRPILELTTRGILGSVDGVTKSFGSSHGTCGKGDPGQGVPVWMGGGEVRMRGIQLGE
ncbi:MAG: TldD/PmbA family protein [Promethearchaeota archaeon]